MIDFCRGGVSTVVPTGKTGSKAKTAEDSIRDIPDVQEAHS